MSFARSKMTMRALIKRAAGTDGYGGPSSAAPLAINPAAPCLVYTRSDRQMDTGGKVVTVGEMLGLFKASEDIKEGDVIASVQDRSGTEIYAGPLYVNVVTPRSRGSVVSHLEVGLKRSR